MGVKHNTATALAPLNACAGITYPPVLRCDAHGLTQYCCLYGRMQVEIVGQSMRTDSAVSFDAENLRDRSVIDMVGFPMAQVCWLFLCGGWLRPVPG